MKIDDNYNCKRKMNNQVKELIVRIETLINRLVNDLKGLAHEVNKVIEVQIK